MNLFAFFLSLFFFSIIYCFMAHDSDKADKPSSLLGITLVFVAGSGCIGVASKEK